MTATTRVLAINGSYRDNGITDQALAAARKILLERGAEVETIDLRRQEIDFCLNCRACTQVEGTDPGTCVIDDGMHDIVRKIEDADAYILAVPTNYSSATAIFKRFMERLTVYGYWPWGATGPKDRKQHLPRKKALLITSCAAPGIFGRVLYGTGKQLRMVAKIIGAKTIGTVYIGLISDTPDAGLPGRARMRTEELAAELL
ncbi:MAG: flavodoxin family protein [Woeseiaceae bacterium]|nr:flavodoxin family protein [Woeseiaceae bacterium]